MKKTKVAILKTRPETVLDDYRRLAKLAGMKEALDVSATTILKDNISWHLPMPGANSTPWQLEGVVLALKDEGMNDIVSVENKTVVTRPKYGEKQNKYDIVYEKYNIPVLYNFEPKDMSWIEYTPKSKLTVLPKIFPEGVKLPDYFFGK
ncbi:iron-sulfur cluster-binding protein, partial [Mesotoga sp. SC_NapDC2]